MNRRKIERLGVVTRKMKKWENCEFPVDGSGGAMPPSERPGRGNCPLLPPPGSATAPDFSLYPTGNNPKVINLGSEAAMAGEILEKFLVYRWAEMTRNPWLLSSFESTAACMDRTVTLHVGYDAHFVLGCQLLQTPGLWKLRQRGSLPEDAAKFRILLLFYRR